MVRRELPPRDIRPFARTAEALGYDELWVIEDCFWTTGIAGAALVLGATERVHVGIGILPAVLRNPALAAMEIATLAGAHPGRLTAGFGPGVAGWMKQVGAYPPSPMAALEATIADTRALLHGATVRNARLDDVTLEYPPDPVPTVLAGVGGPRGLEVAGRVGDGAILAECCPPPWVATARGMLSAEAQLVVYAWLSVAEDGGRARDALRPAVADFIARQHRGHALRAASFADELPARAVPDAWIDELAVSGTPAECHAAIERLGAAGADTVVLIPPLEEAAEQLALLRRRR
jgi:alkanesulfonate monooxygenase SsuD/methylene tetrahydromethanopterin reductase-like flavin-dependent oxidoreductase (luciferase family)